MRHSPPFLEILLAEAARAPRRAPTAAEVRDREIVDAMSIAERIAMSSQLATLSSLPDDERRRRMVGRVFLR